MMNWQKEREEFDRKFDRAEKAFSAIFICVAILALGAMGGIGYTVYRILLHFGIF